MKHFVISVTYTAPIEKIEEIRPSHRSFLQIGYDIGFILCSGPRNPMTGGIIIARAESKEEIRIVISKRSLPH